MDDRDLARRFGAGDETAIRDAYARFSGPVFTVAMSSLRNRELASEAVQQTFLQAWRGASGFDPTRELGPWIYAIARRVAIDIYRRESRAAEPADPADADVPVTPLSFERTWEAWEVRAALDQLPEEEREVMRLSHFEGLSHPEIAERMGVPVGTVKSRSHRAHRRLANLLGHLVEVAT